MSRYLWFTCVFIVLSVLLDFVWSTCYSRCFLSVSLALSCLVLIKDCYLSLRPRLRVPVSSLLCAPWQKPRPNRKRRPFTSFFFFSVFSSFYLFASPLASSPHARRLREISATGCGYPKPAGWFSSFWVAAPPSPPFAGDHATVRGENQPTDRGSLRSRRRPRLTEPAVRGRWRRRPRSSHLPPCRRGGSGCWGTLWGPLTPCHAQRKPQLPSQPRRASGSCGMSCPVCLALEGFFLLCTVLFV